jgi:hypothetical protein
MYTKISAAVLAVVISLSLAAQDSIGVFPHWPKGAPGFESRRNIPEQARIIG